jgi:hypothetical protein
MRSITNANFSCQAGRGGWGREARIENYRSLAEVEAISNNVERSPEDWSLKMIAQEAVAVLASKRGPWSRLQRSSQVSGIVSSAWAVELFRYRYNAGDGLPTP